MSFYTQFTTKEIKPKGWLKKQLEIQAAGLCGNLDKVWPDVRDSKWIGGTCEGWERVPYWLDGFIPMAFLLEDEDMISRAKRFIDAIIDGQCEDGWICPCSEEEREKYDTWALLLIAKVLKVWYDSTGDERIPKVTYRALKNFYELLEAKKLSLITWGQYRWYECFNVISWLHGIYKEEWLISLAKILKEQGINFDSYMHTWKRPLNKWVLYTHIVNLMMMLKSEVYELGLTKDKLEGLAEKYYNELYKYNGTAIGLITGDECLSGISPVQGTELCAVVELMYSLEAIYAATGDYKWAELLEKVALNGLPATLTEDMWAHQYLQQSNQIECVGFPGKSFFRTNGREAHIFGLEPHFGCCTSNFGQGWPKLAISTFMKSKNGINCAVPLPSVIKTEIDGKEITVELKTDYPFKNTLNFTITAKEPLKADIEVRIPSFAKNITVNGVPHASTKRLVIGRKWEGKTDITVKFETTPQLEKTPVGMYAARYGSLYFSMPIDCEYEKREYERNGVERKFPYCDYYLRRKSDWEFGFASDSLKITEHELSGAAFTNDAPPITMEAELAPIDWGYFDGYDSVADRLPHSNIAKGKKRKVTLLPYGIAKLRMTEMPRVRKVDK